MPGHDAGWVDIVAGLRTDELKDPFLKEGLLIVSIRRLNGESRISVEGSELNRSESCSQGTSRSRPLPRSPSMSGRQHEI